MRILSWNVNGLRAAAKRGFTRWLSRCGADIVGVQEVRAELSDLPPRLTPERMAGRWHAHYSSAGRRGYSGVALFSRRPPDSIETSLGAPRFDREGRLQTARFGRVVVVNCYFPNGNGSARDNSRVPYKLAFYRALFEKLQRLRQRGYRVLVMGDFNTDPVRARGSDPSAVALLEYVGERKRYRFLSPTDPRGPATYAGIARIDHVVSDAIEGDCVIPGSSPGTEDVFPDAIYWDHKPVVCQVRFTGER